MRQWITLTALAVLVVLAGCSGGGGGERTPEPITANASQATVSDAALSETGFAETATEQVRVNRSGTLSIAGDVQMNLGYRVRATGWRTVYEPSEASSRRVVSLYTVPLAKPERVDATIDPLGDRSITTVVGQAQGTYDSVESLEHARNRTVAMLETNVTVREYTATATADGDPTDVSVHVATVEHRTDVVRAVAISHRSTDGWGTVRTLFAGSQH